MNQNNPTITITYRFLSLLHKLTCTIRPAQRIQIANVIGKFLFFLLPFRKSVARKNLMKAFPNKSDYWITKTLYNCYQFYSWNLFQFITLPQAFHETNIEVVGKDIIDNYLKEENGAILVTGHFGSWELLGAWLGYNGYAAVGVAQQQRNAGAHQFFYERRGSFGMVQIGRRTKPQKMAEFLKANFFLCLISDQDARKQGVFVNFFNQPSSTPKGMAIFHYRTKSPIVFATIVQLSPDKYEVEFEKVPLPENRNIQELTQSFTTMLESKIKEYPEQYFWFHKRWKTKPQ